VTLPWEKDHHIFNFKREWTNSLLSLYMPKKEQLDIQFGGKMGLYGWEIPAFHLTITHLQSLSKSISHFLPREERMGQKIKREIYEIPENNKKQPSKKRHIWWWEIRSFFFSLSPKTRINLTKWSSSFERRLPLMDGWWWDIYQPRWVWI